MNIFFSVDSYAIEGLGIALTSMLRNCSNSEYLKIWVLCSNITPNDKEIIKQLLKNEDFKGEWEFIAFDADNEFKYFKRIYGNKLSYGRFLIPEILKSGHAFYLDADIVVNLDILDLQNYTSDKLIGAVERRKFKNTIENDFLINKLGLKPETSYFNAGILIINLDEWHRKNISDKLIDLARRFPNDLLQADQTMLNVLCNGNYTQIPNRFNNGFSSFEPKNKVTAKTIVHFISYPKPWDIWGDQIHNGYACWVEYRTSFWENCYNKITFSKLLKVWGKKGLYVKAVLKRLKLREYKFPPNSTLS